MFIIRYQESVLFLQIYITEQFNLFNLGNMKPNRTNSFRLQRVSRASSLKKQSHTFYQPDETFKLAPINSVSKGVKHAELTFLTGNDLHKLRKEPLDDYEGHYESIHGNLIQIRAKYDDMKKQRVEKDNLILKLKDQINKYKIFENQYQSKINKASSDVERMIKDLNDKKLLLQETSVQKKVLMHMQHRLKEDKVVYDQKKFNLQKEERFLKKQKSVFEEDRLEMGQGTDRTSKVYEKLQRELQAENNERQEHIDHLLQMIRKKVSANEMNVIREKELLQIGQRAMQDKDPRQKEWYKTYLTHSFVSKMLKNKIDREMEKFAVVEEAFKSIKIATGINNAENLVFKYLNKEGVYGDLLGRITSNEQKISELQEETQRLRKEEKELEMERQTIQSIKMKSIDIEEQFKELSSMEERKKNIETCEGTISKWLIKQFKKFQLIQKIQNIPPISRDKTQLAQALKIYTQILAETLKKCQISDKESEVATEAGDLTNRDSARVTRIFPKKSRKNSIGEDIYDVDEEQISGGANVQQEEIINNQRQQMIRNNEKFMIEAQKRYEQKRKIMMIEREAAKKEKKAPEVKKEEDQ